MTMHRIRIQVDSEQLVANYRHICSLVGKTSKVLAVVKANAYGHGAVQVCKLLLENGCEYFAVACIEEALELREQGVGGKILILGNTDPAYAPQLRQWDLIQAVDSVAYAQALSANGGVSAHIKVDTGMSRLGLYCHTQEDAAAVCEQVETIHRLPNIHIDGIFTHFADSDGEDSAFTLQQFAVFEAVLGELERRHIPVGLRHCCNSAGILRFPQAHLDMVRAGLILYGLMPSPFVQDGQLQPAIRLIARISAVNHIRKGDRVSYGGTFVAPRDMRVAVLSIGYADGLPRSLSDNLTVFVNGHSVPLIGKICMDLCMADIGDVPCKAGDEAVIFSTAEEIESIAKKLGTINYEVLCLSKKRVAIEYL